MSWMLQPDQVVVWSDAPVDELLNVGYSPIGVTGKTILDVAINSLFS